MSSHAANQEHIYGLVGPVPVDDEATNNALRLFLQKRAKPQRARRHPLNNLPVDSFKNRMQAPRNSDRWADPKAQTSSLALPASLAGTPLATHLAPAMPEMKPAATRPQAWPSTALATPHRSSVCRLASSQSLPSCTLPASPADWKMNLLRRRLPAHLQGLSTHATRDAQGPVERPHAQPPAAPSRSLLPWLRSQKFNQIQICPSALTIKLYFATCENYRRK